MMRLSFIGTRGKAKMLRVEDTASVVDDASEEVRKGKRESGGEAIDVDEARVAGAALDVAQVGPVDAGLVGQILWVRSSCSRRTLIAKPKRCRMSALNFPIAATLAACRL